MKNTTICVSGLVFLLLAAPASAVTIYECVDEDGNAVYRDRCPPGTTPANEKKIRTGSGSGSPAQAADSTQAPDVDITFYMVPDCDACVILRNMLNEYGASFTERNINSGEEVKRELQEKTGGGSTLTVPTIIVGETVIAGYKKNELASTLEQAGYKKPAAPEPEAEEEETAEDLAENAFVEEEQAPAQAPEGETAPQ